MQLLGSMTAEQRLFAFLLSLTPPPGQSEARYSADRFHLRMTREISAATWDWRWDGRVGCSPAAERGVDHRSTAAIIELKNPEALKDIVGHW